MGLLGITIDIGTMMTASAAMGIAVDDTLHFLVWYRRGTQRFTSRRRAVRFAFRHCATAMFQTSIICGLGLLVFMASPFTPIARFGLVMAIMLALALLGDLVLLPAALCSSLGKSRRSRG
jgi:predicted RND superfamily exporter protein